VFFIVNGLGLAFPAVHSLLVMWVSPGKRSSAVAIVTSASYMGAVLALSLSPMIAENPRLQWPWIFYFFGIFGLGWTLIWYLLIPPIRSSPSTTPISSTVNVDETTLQTEENDIVYMPFSSSPCLEESELLKEESSHTPDPSIPWKSILQEPSVWAIIINQFCNSWGFWVLLSWLPSFYSDRFHESLSHIGLFSSNPILTTILISPFWVDC
jgi:MFS family permease